MKSRKSLFVVVLSLAVAVRAQYPVEDEDDEVAVFARKLPYFCISKYNCLLSVFFFRKDLESQGEVATVALQ